MNWTQLNIIRFLLAACAIGWFAGASRADDLIKANNTASLNSAGSWSGAVIPSNADNGVWSSTVTGANTVSLGGDMIWGGIKIINPGGSVIINAGNNLGLNGVAGTGVDMSAAMVNVTLNNNVLLGADQAWNVTNGRTLTVGGLVSGSRVLAKTGDGRLIFKAANDYTGVTLVQAGSLQIGNSGALGDASIGTIVSDGATLEIGLNNSTIFEPITLAGVGANGNGALRHGFSGNYYSNNLCAGLITLAGAAAISASGGGYLQIAGGVSSAGYNLTLQAFAGGSGYVTNTPLSLGTGNLIKNQDGAWTLAVAGNNYGDTIVNQGLFKLGILGAIPASSTVYVQRRLINNPALLDVNGFDQSIGGLASTNDLGVITNGVSGTRTLTVGGNNADTVFSGALVAGTGSIALIKVGAGKLSLNGTNTSTGAIAVNDGTLGGTGSVAGPVTITGSGSLAPDGLAGTFTISNNLTLAGTTVVDVDGAAPANDLVRVTSNAAYGGTLVVNATNIFPANSNVFKIFDVAGTTSGNFTNIVLPPSMGLAASFNPATGLLTLSIGPFQTLAGIKTPPPSPLGDASSLYPSSFFPFVDRLGQYKHLDWPNKPTWNVDLTNQLVAESNDLAANPGPTNWCDYGGWSDGPMMATNVFFRVQKYQGQWWLVDPHGHLFWSHGMDGCNDPSEKTGVTGRTNYFEALPASGALLQFLTTVSSPVTGGYYDGTTPVAMDFLAANAYRKYGPDWTNRTRALTHTRLRSWNLNTIGSWTGSNVYLVSTPRRTPYATVLYPASIGLINGDSRLPDYFNTNAFTTGLTNALDASGARADSWCLGFYVNNEMTWTKASFAPNDLSRATLQAAGTQPAKNVFRDLLKAKYANNLTSLNTAWGVNYTSWADFLNQRTTLPAGSGGDADLTDFYRAYAGQFFRVARDVIKGHSAHLFLGSRFANQPQRLAGEAATNYVDVATFNQYNNRVSIVNGLEADVPVMVTEYHFCAPDTGLFDGGLNAVTNQAQRASRYTDHFNSAITNSRVVGIHWFSLRDRPASGSLEGNGTDQNDDKGFLSITDTPYDLMVAAARAVGASMYSVRINASSTNVPSRPTVLSTSMTNGQLQLLIGGDSGPDYYVQVSTNLVDWQTVSTNLAPAVPFYWSDPDATNFQKRFYRVQQQP